MTGDVHDVTGIPQGVVEGAELRAVDGVGNLRDQHGRGVRYFCHGTREYGETSCGSRPLTRNAQTETEEETVELLMRRSATAGAKSSPSADELVYIRASRLKGSTDQHNRRTNPNSRATADAIRKIRGEGETCQRTDVLR